VIKGTAPKVLAVAGDETVGGEPLSGDITKQRDVVIAVTKLVGNDRAVNLTKTFCDAFSTKRLRNDAEVLIDTAGKDAEDTHIAV
jgi:hypothetical protein